MRDWFDRLPIHRKLVTSALLITAVALLIVTVGLSLVDAVRHRAGAVDDARALAQVLAENAAAAVLFDEPEAAQELLQSVRVREVVTRACLYRSTGDLFAGYSRGIVACPPTSPAPDVWRGVVASAAVTRSGRTHGFVFVEHSIADLRGRFYLTALAGVLMLGIAAFVAYLMAERVNVAISRPISELAGFARGFNADGGRAFPAIAAPADELGELVSAFGGMVARVRDSERRFRMLADGSPVLLWVNGHEGCEFVNRAYLAFIGLPDDTSVRGYDWSRFVHPDDRDAYLAQYARAYRERAPFQAEFRFLRADGAWRWLRSDATPRVEDEAFAGYVGATIDITDRRRAEEALREADARKDAFLAILAHELRNPLAPIRTGLELLRVGGDTPALIERLRPVLDRQVGHMVRLIDDLLDVSRITTGKIQLQRQPTSLAELVQVAVDANRAAIDGAGLGLSVRVPTEPCILDVDPTRFVQVLTNLLHNATKFTERGGEITLEATLDAGRSPAVVTLSVADTGIGIPPSMLSHVFELFAQGDGPRGAKSGLGIGLGLARQLIELHGGQIAARSDGAGRGSVFTITMPVVMAGAAALASGGGEAEPPRLTECRVLVIDDNVDAADTLAALVMAIGGEARTAYDGRAGVTLTREFQPDVVLLDIGMPGMDGYETCQLLRRQGPGRDAYIVALTGWGQVHDRERALAGGFDAHLTKPADPRMLEKLLVECPRRG